MGCCKSMIRCLFFILYFQAKSAFSADATDSIFYRTERTLLSDSTYRRQPSSVADSVKPVRPLKLAEKTSGIFPAADLRSLDGLFLGLGYKITHADTSENEPGFQKISAMKNFNSEAFQVKYRAQWNAVFKNTDLVVDGFADVKGNILNYFGRGNESSFDRNLDFRTFYRVKFSLFQLDPAFRFNLAERLSLSVGPSVQYFKFNPADNTDRFINALTPNNPFESFKQDRVHGGLIVQLNWDKRDNKLLPTKGLNFSLQMQAYKGLNGYSGSFSQYFPQLSFYRSLDPKGVFVLADRIGAGFTFGTTAFYQSAFLGSQDNLLGFRKFRFAGDHLVYNNFETRITLWNAEGQHIKGKLGLIGFYDVGRVWIENETSTTLHHGYGGGLFISPFNRFLVRAVVGFSKERRQITAAVRQRF
jgi:outer membrane protein assembly factor BamA